MFGNFFNNNSIRKSVTVFGNMFNDIKIVRYDANKKVIQTIPVPITYARKSKMVSLHERDHITTKVQSQLPVISFMMTSITYGSDRKTSSINKNKVKIDPQIMNVQFAEIPYNLDFELYIMAKSYDDAAQIVEQIIPYFQPSFTPTVKMVPELDLSYDLKTTLTGLAIQDDFEGSTEEQGFVLWTLNFTMNSYFFGPTQKQGVIKRAIVDLVSVPGSGEVTGEDVEKFGRSSRITTTPGLTADGQPTTLKENSIPYTEIEIDDPYGFVTELEVFDDGKKYDPYSGTDK